MAELSQGAATLQVLGTKVEQAFPVEHEPTVTVPLPVMLIRSGNGGCPLWRWVDEQFKPEQDQFALGVAVSVICPNSAAQKNK